MRLAAQLDAGATRGVPTQGTPTAGSGNGSWTLASLLIIEDVLHRVSSALEPLNDDGEERTTIPRVSRQGEQLHGAGDSRERRVEVAQGRESRPRRLGWEAHPGAHAVTLARMQHGGGIRSAAEGAKN